MTHASLLGDGLPVTLPGFEHRLDSDINGLFHPTILVKHSLDVKEHITSMLAHACGMQEKPPPVNEVVAKNLAYWMDQRGVKQAHLAEKAGVSQKTVSNYLNPHQRIEGASGKIPSAKLSELESIAIALEIELWQLVRHMTPSERAMHLAIERAYNEFRASIQ